MDQWQYTSRQRRARADPAAKGQHARIVLHRGQGRQNGSYRWSPTWNNCLRMMTGAPLLAGLWSDRMKYVIRRICAIFSPTMPFGVDDAFDILPKSFLDVFGYFELEDASC